MDQQKRKRCIHCDEVKGLAEFYSHPMMKDGRLNSCKECHKKNVSKSRRKNIDHYRRYEQKRFQTSKRKTQVKRHQEDSRRRDPQKYKARCLFSNAVRDNLVVRECCEICGGEPAEGHHEDYSKPLEVRWLCFICHRREHGQNPAPRPGLGIESVKEVA